MTDSIKSIALIVSFSLLALYSFWLVEVTQRQQQGQKSSPELFDSYLHNVLSREYDDHGNLKSVVKAPLLFHFQQGNRSEITNPDYLQYREKKPPVRVTAEHGTLFDGSKKIFLKQNVHVTQPPFANKAGVTLRTETLTIYPKQNYAETDSKVLFISDNNSVAALGMQTNWQTQWIQLTGQVKGIYHGTT